MGKALGKRFSLLQREDSRIFLIVSLAISMTMLGIQNAEALDCSSSSTSKFVSAGIDNKWSNAANWALAGPPTTNSQICIGDDNNPQSAELDVNFNLPAGGMIHVPHFSSLTIPNGVTLEIELSSSLVNMGTLSNSGILNNAGNFQNNGGVFDNFGKFTNTNFMINSQLAAVNNYNLIENKVNQYFFPTTINNQGTFTNFCPDSSVLNELDPNPPTEEVDIINNPDGLFIGSNVVGPQPVKNTIPPPPFTAGLVLLDCQPPLEVVGSSNGGGVISYGPTIGVNPMTNEFVVQRGFGIDGQEVDVKNWYTPHGWNREPGTHTFTLRILSDLGVQAITGVQLFTSEIGKWDANDPIWKVALKRPMGSNWTIEVSDKNDLIGDVTFTTLSIEDRYLLVSITISNMDPTPENYAIGVRMIDDIGGMNSNWFNDGLIIEDTFAYPSEAEFFEQKLSSPVVCTEQDDPNDRYTCAFEQKKQSELIKAQESFSIITENKVISNFAADQESTELPLRPNDSQNEQLIQDKTQSKGDIYLNFESLQNNTLENLSKKIYLNFESLQ